MTATGNNTGIDVPDDLIERLGAGRRPAVTVNVNGFEYQTTIGVMGGRNLISISAAIRKQTGLKAGDPIHVELTLADRPREVAVPDDLAAALAADPTAAAFFATLSNSVQRYHVDTINAAKTDQTRHRRIDKAIALFQQQRQR
ncbi:MAG: YdeI/OmpD-associated family protein [Actinomycetota bacterium]|nr:YdeI/OmpD-associated family protein [Actinomycetota bacterium]